MNSQRLLCLLAAAGFALAGPAFAQYQWRDNGGQMVYSDKPPPIDIKPSQIIRAQALPNYPQAMAPAAAPTAQSASLADRDLDDKRKAKERDEAERKRREATDRTARTAQACDQMRTEQRTLDSGMRIATVNAAGEREFISDEARAQRSDSLKKEIAETCNAG